MQRVLLLLNGLYGINSSKGVRWLKCKSKDQRISLLETILQSEWFLLKMSLLKPSTELRYCRKILILTG